MTFAFHKCSNGADLAPSRETGQLQTTDGRRRDDAHIHTREVLGSRIEGGVVPPFREPIAATDSTVA